MRKLVPVKNVDNVLKCRQCVEENKPTRKFMLVKKTDGGNGK